MIKNRLDLLLAAEKTALKNLDSKSALDATSLVVADFKALKIGEHHFEEFNRMVANRTADFRNLRASELEPAAAPKPLEA